MILIAEFGLSVIKLTAAVMDNFYLKICEPKYFKVHLSGHYYCSIRDNIITEFSRPNFSVTY